MNRPRSTSIAVFAPALFALAVSTSACSSRPEDPLIRQFFRASQLRDNQTLANFATVTFDPDKDGIVSSFDITNVTEERREPLMLKDLAKVEEAARAADDEFNKKKKAYQDANLDAIERVLKAESAKRPLAGRDAAVQTAWRKWRDDQGTSAKAVSEARSKLNAARPVVELSVQNLAPVDVATVDGQVVSKDVTINAQVRMASGDTVEKQLVFSMVRAELSIPGKAEPQVGRWVITAIKG
jgi:hypothetical protein